MNLNRAELKKIMYRFNTACSRLLQADYEDYDAEMRKFLAVLNSEELIHSYILSCGECSQNMAAEVNEVAQSFGRAWFDIGTTPNEEVCTIYALLTYLTENEYDIVRTVGTSYSSSRKFQDMAKGFNSRVVMVLIRHIDSYLTQIGIDMGIDDKVVHSVQVTNGSGQVNIAFDQGTVTASQYNGASIQDIIGMINEAKAIIEKAGLPADVADEVSDDLEVIKEQLSLPEPKKNRIMNAIGRVKKFVTDVGTKVLVTVAAKSITDFNWVGLFAQIESLIP